jgi:hypothetical protein
MKKELRHIRCRLVPNMLSGEYSAFYPPDKPKAVGIVMEADILDKKDTKGGIYGYVPYEHDRLGFGRFTDERQAKFTPRLKDVRRTNG